MIRQAREKLTLDRPVPYQISVPGALDRRWTDWNGSMTITVTSGDDDRPVTTLTGTIDQATLQGLLRRLYALGLPLISVRWLADQQEDDEDGL